MDVEGRVPAERLAAVRSVAVRGLAPSDTTRLNQETCGRPEVAVKASGLVAERSPHGTRWLQHRRRAARTRHGPSVALHPWKATPPLPSPERWFRTRRARRR